MLGEKFQMNNHLRLKLQNIERKNPNWKKICEDDEESLEWIRCCNLHIHDHEIPLGQQ